MGKIVKKDELLGRMQAARIAGQTIVHCHGCFDIVHPGHVRYLEFARRQGDLLIVSLTGDSQITKGDQRPYIPEELRAENLAALSAVDLVYIDPHPTAAELLSELRPDVYVKGREYERSGDPNFVAEREIVTRYGGRVVFSSGDVVFSSSRLIDALDPDRSLESERLTLICRRQGLDRASTEGLLASLANLRVLVVGDVVLDRYVLCDATELADEAAIMSLSRLEERVYVGGAGIVARHSAGLGATTYLLSSCAGDEASSMARRVFENESVQARLTPCRSSLPEKTRYLVDTTKLLRVEQGASHPLDSTAQREAAGWVESIAAGLDAVIFCDFGYGTITGGLLDQMRNVLSGQSPIISADVSGPRARLLQFKRAALLCPTERSLRSALHDFDRGLSAVAWEALEQTQARHLLVTLGKKGLVVFDRQSQDADRPEWRGRLRSEYLPSLAERVIDPLGCGDALLATTTLLMAAGASLMQAAYLGSAAAAIAIARLGNVPIDLNTLQAWLTERVELAPSPDLEPDVSVPASESTDVLQAILSARQQTQRRRRLRHLGGEALPVASEPGHKY